MKIILSHAYFLNEDAREKEIMKPYPPLGLLSISAYLKMKGMKNEVYDTTFGTYTQMKEYLLAQQPDVLGLYANLMTKIRLLEIINFIHSQHSLRHTKIVLGGPDVRYNVENYLRAGADICVIGEGEETFLELCEAYQIPNNPWLDHIAGIAYLNIHKEIFYTTEREKLKDIDLLPMPHREAIDMHKYLKVWKEHHGASAMSISTQRGCPYTCRWCSTAVYGQSYRRRSVENVVAEMKLLKEQYAPDTLWFVDDVFTVSHKWLSAFRDELQKQGIYIPFECITRADRLTGEVIKVLKEAGCYRVWIGAESGSQAVIDRMDRRVKVSQVREMLLAAKAEGIETGTFIMLGYPGETEEDILETIHHLTQSDPDNFTITIAYPIKGTGLYEETLSTHTTSLPWNQSTDREIDFQRLYPRSYYEYAVRYVVNEVKYKLSLKKPAIKPWSIAGYKLRALRGRAGMWASKKGWIG